MKWRHNVLLGAFSKVGRGIRSVYRTGRSGVGAVTGGVKWGWQKAKNIASAAHKYLIIPSQKVVDEVRQISSEEVNAIIAGDDVVGERYPMLRWWILNIIGTYRLKIIQARALITRIKGLLDSIAGKFPGWIEKLLVWLGVIGMLAVQWGLINLGRLVTPGWMQWVVGALLSWVDLWLRGKPWFWPFQKWVDRISYALPSAKELKD